MSGDARSFQNCCGADKVPGGFDSHTLPPASELLRQLPAVSQFLDSVTGVSLSQRFGVGVVKSELRLLLEQLRQDILQQQLSEVPSVEQLGQRLQRQLQRFCEPEGRAAINAAGVLLHTGLGRAPLCKEALEALAGMGEYSLLQTSISTGRRSLREEKVERMLMELTGCEAATVVNNNAAATMLTLNTVAEGREVVISRGQLVEIGGAFRIPDVMERSSAILKEIGTTNRTHVKDYEQALCEQTGAILHVHTSNYRIRGFAGTPGIDDLCAVGQEHNVPVIDDLGSGALVALSRFGLSDEPLVRDSIAAGATVACFSGDKLICGPQSGIICGTRDVIARIRKNPFARMFRPCKLTLAALEATLLHFINDTYRTALPFYQMLTVSDDVLQGRAEILLAGLADCKALEVEVVDDISYVGSGSLPDSGLPGCVVRIRMVDDVSPLKNIDQLAAKIRGCTPSIFCRVQDNAAHFDMRTIFDGQAETIAQSIRAQLA